MQKGSIEGARVLQGLKLKKGRVDSRAWIRNYKLWCDLESAKLPFPWIWGDTPGWITLFPLCLVASFLSRDTISLAWMKTPSYLTLTRFIVGRISQNTGGYRSNIPCKRARADYWSHLRRSESRKEVPSTQKPQRRIRGKEGSLVL